MNVKYKEGVLIGPPQRIWPFGLPSLPRGASTKTLINRLRYNNRKGRSALRRLRTAARIELAGSSTQANNVTFVITEFIDQSSVLVVGVDT